MLRVSFVTEMRFGGGVADLVRLRRAARRGERGGGERRPPRERERDR